MIEITNQTLGDLYLKNALRSADYAGALGYSSQTLKFILNYAKDKDFERIEELAHSALEQIENVFIKHEVK